VLDLLAQLVDRSIILAVERYGAERYRMLETLRQYATERLAEQGNAAAVHERHAGHYLARAERESGDLFVVSLAELDGLEAEHDNLRAALHWFAGHDDTERCLRLGAALQTFWYVRGYYREGQGYLTAALASDRTVSVAVRAKALVAVGWLAIWSGEHAAALVWLQEGLALYRRLGDRTGIARALLLLGWVARHQGEDAQAHLLLEQSLGISRDTSDASVISAALLNLGIIALQRHDFLRARSLLEEALALVRTLDLPWPLGSTLYHLGIVAEELGEHAHAHALYEESLRLALALGFRGLLVFILEALASLVAAQGGDAPEHRMAHALRLAAASAAEREKLGSPRTAYMPPRFERAVALARSALGAEAAAAAWAAGRAMSLEEAVAYALAEGPEAPLDGSGNPP
jgi:tetratricopeptide (TPR) repeat protein